MNQILVYEKLYVTPELRRKKKIYKINFIISVVIIIVLCLSYAHSEYAKFQEQDISDEVLSQLIEDEEQISEEERKIAKEQDEGVWKIMIASTKKDQEEESSTSTNTEANTNNNTTTTTKKSSSSSSKSSSNSSTVSTAQRSKIIKASNGKRYPSLGRIEIPKIGVDCTIFDEPEDEEQMVAWLKVSPCKFYGADPNQIGNCSIAGHNYRNKRFFSKVPNLVVGDKIKITDISGTTITYSVYDKYTVYPEETDCVNEEIPGKRIVTLITCTNDSKQRVIIHAKEI